MKHVKMLGRDAAFFLLGYEAALRRKHVTVPKYLSKQVAEAELVSTCGSYRGPLAVLDMENLANRLNHESGHIETLSQKHAVRKT